MPETVHLVDASPYIFRAFFSIPSSFTNPQDKPVNAVYGFCQFLRRLQAIDSVTHLALAFDESLTTSFRNEIYEPYKAQRELPPEDLKNQLQWCRRAGEALGAATFSDLRYEADDLIATLCRPLAAAGHRVVVVTSDKDLTQLVTHQVELWDFAKDTRFGPQDVVEKFGVEPRQVVDLLALMGDSVDNIPGVKGVGKTSAVALLRTFDSLEQLYGRLEEVPEMAIRGAKSLRRKLEEQREMAFLSKRLADLAYDAPAVAEVDALRMSEPDSAALEVLQAELGFHPLTSGRGRGRQGGGSRSAKKNKKS